MAIELTTVPTETAIDTADILYFVDVSETPDAINQITVANFFGTNLAQIKALADPNADRLLFWDDSAGAFAHLTLGTNLSITGTTIDAAGGGGIGGSTGATDNAILRADGTGGATAQSSGATIDDNGFITSGGSSAVRTWIMRDLNGNNLSALYNGAAGIGDSTYVLGATTTDTRLNTGGGGSVTINVANTPMFKIDDSATATHTRMLVYDVDNATLERVTVGAADSGGAGFKLLRIPN